MQCTADPFSDTGMHSPLFPVLGLVKNGTLWAPEKAWLFLSQSAIFYQRRDLPGVAEVHK